MYVTRNTNLAHSLYPRTVYHSENIVQYFNKHEWMVFSGTHRMGGSTTLLDTVNIASASLPSLALYNPDTNYQFLQLFYLCKIYFKNI